MSVCHRLIHLGTWCMVPRRLVARHSQSLRNVYIPGRLWHCLWWRLTIPHIEMHLPYYVWAHLIRVSRSAYRSAWSAWPLILQYGKELSATRFSCESATWLGISLMKTKISKGLRTDPRVTPDITGWGLDFSHSQVWSVSAQTTMPQSNSSWAPWSCMLAVWLAA